MPTRIHLYLLSRHGLPGDFQSLGSAHAFLPSLWQVLLAGGERHSRPAPIIGNDSDGWIATDAQAALLRYERFTALLVQHPQFAQVGALDRYLRAVQQFLSDVISQWGLCTGTSPLLCADLAQLPLPTGQPDHVASLHEFQRRLDEIVRTRDFDAIEALLQFPSRNLRFIDWKAWSGRFGLAQFEPPYFSSAFREPSACEYIDYDYDEFGSEPELGYGCRRYREGGLWGVAHELLGCSSTMIEPVWDRVLRTGRGDQTLIWVQRAARFGLASIAGEQAGRMLRGADLDDVSGFHHDVAIVRVGERMGLLDGRGQWRLQPCMNEIQPFAHGIAVVRRDGKFGFIDAQGATIVAPQFDEADDFTAAGVARVRSAACCGLIDRTGRVVLPLRFSQLEWSDEFCGWLGTGAGGLLLLAHADGGVWLDAQWQAIEVFVRHEMIRVRSGSNVGLLRWNGEALLPCEFEALVTRDPYGAGPVSAQGKMSQVKSLRPRKAAAPVGDGRALEIIARRNGLTAMFDRTGRTLIPFEYAHIDAMEPHVEGHAHLVTPNLMRVVSVPGNAAPRVGVWDIAQERCIVPCAYDFIWTCLFAADGTYGFIVGNRNPKRGPSANARYRVGLLRADASVLVPQEYAWIAESTPLNRDDAMMDIRSTLYHAWSRGEPVRASLGENGPRVALDSFGTLC